MSPLQADPAPGSRLPPPLGPACSSQPRPPNTPYLVPEFGSGLLCLPRATLTGSCYCTSALERGLPHSASFSLCSKSVPCGKMDVWLAYLGAPRAKSTWDLPEWVAYQTTLNDFHLVSSFTKICLFFILLPCGWLYFKDVLSYVVLFCLFWLGLNILKHRSLHQMSCSAKRICRPIMKRVFHAWQIGCRQHHLKLAETPTNKTLLKPSIFEGIFPNLNGCCPFLSFFCIKQVQSWMQSFNYPFVHVLVQNLQDHYLKKENLQ